jgi:hypothetical protein
MLREKGVTGTVNKVVTGNASNLSISLCPKCMCMMYNVFDGSKSIKCGKCGSVK